MTLLLQLLLKAQARLPLALNQQLGRWIGALNVMFGSRSAQVTRQNLELCFPELSQAERNSLCLRSMKHTGMTALESPSVWLRPKQDTRRWLGKVENEQLLDDAMKSGNGTLILLPHLGNWEMFNVYFSNKGRMTALYHPPRQDWLKPLMASVRGDNLVPTNRQGLARLYKELEEGHVVTILPDQVPASGDFAPFFGEPALTDRLASRMLKKTGAKALMCVVYRDNGKFNVRFSQSDPAIYDEDIATSLGALNRSIEQSAEGLLDQYQWEYKRFRERPTGLKKLYKFKGQPDYFHE